MWWDWDAVRFKAGVFCSTEFTAIVVRAMSPPCGLCPTYPGYGCDLVVVTGLSSVTGEKFVAFAYAGISP